MNVICCLPKGSLEQLHLIHVDALQRRAPNRDSGASYGDTPAIQSLLRRLMPCVGGPRELVSRHNTGIVISYDIIHAIDAIRANPIGFELPRT